MFPFRWRYPPAGGKDWAMLPPSTFVYRPSSEGMESPSCSHLAYRPSRRPSFVSVACLAVPSAVHIRLFVPCSLTVFLTGVGCFCLTGCPSCATLSPPVACKCQKRAIIPATRHRNHTSLDYTSASENVNMKPCAENSPWRA